MSRNHNQEKIINGVLHFRPKPQGPWKKLSREDLTARIIRLQAQLDAAAEVAIDNILFVLSKARPVPNMDRLLKEPGFFDGNPSPGTVSKNP